MRDYGGMSWPVSARVLVWLTEPRRRQGCWPRFVRVPAAPLAALPCWCRAVLGPDTEEAATTQPIGRCRFAVAS
jgi:hypothetical protein